MRRYVEGVLRLRFAVIGLVLLVSGVLGFQIKNLHVVVDPNATLPQQHPYVAATREAGIRAVHLETDLLGESSRIEQLADSEIDVVSVHLPAMTQTTYAAVMRTEPQQFH